MGNKQSTCEAPDKVVSFSGAVNSQIDVTVLNQMLQNYMWNVTDVTKTNDKTLKQFFKRWTDVYLKEWNNDFLPLGESPNVNNFVMKLPSKSPNIKYIKMFNLCKSNCHNFKNLEVVVVSFENATPIAYVINDKFYNFVESSEIKLPAKDPEPCVKASAKSSFWSED